MPSPMRPSARHNSDSGSPLHATRRIPNANGVVRAAGFSARTDPRLTARRCGRAA